MISGVTKTIQGEAHAFRLGARAMMALEDQFDAGIVEIVQRFQEDAEGGRVRMGTLVIFLSHCAADGDGVSTEEAQTIFDALGIGAAAELMGECVERAFPEAAEEKKPSAKNRKRADRSE